MSNPFSEELLSAYLDGELSASDRAELEHRLESQPRLRERLSDLREVSELVRQMPRPAAPAGLREQVMAHVVRHSANLTHRAAASIPFFRRKSVLAGLAATLLLGVALKLAMQQDPGLPLVDDDFERANRFALNDRITPAIVPVETGESPAVAIYTVTKDEIRRRLSELEDMPSPGNTISVQGRGLRLNGSVVDPPVLVEMTVVDVVQSMNQLQVLLQRPAQGPPVLMQNQMSGNQVQGLLGRGSQFTSVSLEVELDGPQLAEVLNDLPAFDAAVYVSNEAVAESDARSLEDLKQDVASNSLQRPEPPRIAPPDLNRNDYFFQNGDQRQKGANSNQAQNFRFPVLANQDDATGRNSKVVVVDSAPAGNPAHPSSPAPDEQVPRQQPEGLSNYAGQEQLARQWDRLRAIRAVVLFHQQPEPPTVAPMQ